MAKAPTKPVHPLEFVFAQMWEAFIDGASELDGHEIEDIIEKSGLAVWRPATVDDVKRTNVDLEVGDAILCLTPEGIAVVNKGRETK
jgi:hypothetical protein